MESHKTQLSIVKKELSAKWKKSKPIIMKAAGAIGIGGFIVTINKLFHHSNDGFENWLKTVSDEEVFDGYEERRLEWLKNNHGDIILERKI